MPQLSRISDPGSRYGINFAFRAASFACSHAAGSLSATPRATTRAEA
jgi:hypothetical protein